jgi:hypothetical protein
MFLYVLFLYFMFLNEWLDATSPTTRGGINHEGEPPNVCFCNDRHEQVDHARYDLLERSVLGDYGQYTAIMAE